MSPNRLTLKGMCYKSLISKREHELINYEWKCDAILVSFYSFSYHYTSGYDAFLIYLLTASPQLYLQLYLELHSQCGIVTKQITKKH